ncbi:MAG: energy transducer TonB [Caulobacteraceae bacterium]|nr:energy transducer TonB [Caulobacteraceae bacterium]
MARRYISALAALAFTSAAHAQVAAPTPAPSVNMEQFCPDAGERRRFYPERAQERNLDGSARIDCTLTEANTIKICSVIEETPPGFGFGDSALGIACRWVLGPEHVANATVSADGERHVQRTIRFTLGATPPPPNNR